MPPVSSRDRYGRGWRDQSVRESPARDLPPQRGRDLVEEQLLAVPVLRIGQPVGMGQPG
jgi:hypothetical protein